MKNINEILAELGIEVPEEKAEGLRKSVSENYKTVAEFDKRVSRLETERDGFREQLNTATESLKGFEGLDVEGMRTQLAEAQKKAKDAEDEYNRRLADRDFDEALKAEMSGYKFTSKAAEKAVWEQVKNAGLKAVNGKILGLNDFIESIKAGDEDAFVKDDDETPPPAKFTAPLGSGGGKAYKSRDEIMKIKNTKERQAAIEANLDLFI